MNKRIKWSDKKLVDEIECVIQDIGCFPTYTNLLELNRRDLVSSLYRRGGLNKFCSLMGYRIRKNSNGFWKEDTIISSIYTIINNLNHFPSSNDLRNSCNYGLLNAITSNGGINKYRKLLGFKLTDMSLISKYFIVRGQFAEHLIELIFNECKDTNSVTIIKNKRFNDNSVVEFFLIHNINKTTVSVDVTCTDSYHVISEKWKNRNYHLFSDMFIIVVFSKYLTTQDYDLLNKMCPLNVFVVNVKDFIKNLKYDYNNVSEEDIDICINYTFDRYMKEINNGD